MASLVSLLGKVSAFLLTVVGYTAGITAGVAWIGTAVSVLGGPFSLAVLMTGGQDLLYGVAAILAPFHLHLNLQVLGFTFNTDNVPAPPASK